MSRADTIAEMSWRVHILRPDGTVNTTFTSRDPNGADARKFFNEVTLRPGEKAYYQVRHPGRNRYLTFGVRP